MNTIKITESENRITLDLSESMDWPTACLMLCSAIHHMAKQTVDVVYSTLIKEHPTKSSELADGLKSEISADVADMINFAISNVLNDLSPKDPDLQLTEVAIATMENEIIHKAAAEHKSIAQALKEYEEALAKSPYAVKPIGQNISTPTSAPIDKRKEVSSMACGKKKAKKSPKKGGCKKC